MNPPWATCSANDDFIQSHGNRAQTAPPLAASSAVDGPLHPLHPYVLVPGQSPRSYLSGRSDLFFGDKERLPIVNNSNDVPPSAPPRPAAFHATHLKQFAPPLPPPPPIPTRPPRSLSSHHPSLFFEIPTVAIPPLPPPRPSPTPPPSHRHFCATPTLPPIPPKISLSVPSLSSSPTATLNNVSHISASSPAQSVVSPRLPCSLDISSIKEKDDSISTDDYSSKEILTKDTEFHNIIDSHEHEQELAEAIALSEVVSTEERKKRNKITSQEDEDFARALEASLFDADDEQSLAPSKPNSHVPPSVAEIQPPAPLPPESQNESHTLEDDEALARQLAEQERQIAFNHVRGCGSGVGSSVVDFTELPQYVSQVRIRSQICKDSSKTDMAAPELIESCPSTPPTFPRWSPPSYNETDTVPLSRTASIDSACSDDPRNQLNRPENLVATVLAPPIRNIHRAFSLASTVDDVETETGLNSDPSSHGLVNVNSFVDKELFIGVTLGFLAPTISAEIVSMSGVMPNIISLPYGRATPLHIQGPSWRHLLKLMAKLSGTRLEPTVAAMAISKKDLKLRTVVQFIKPYLTSPDWRTILYFSIDFPSPNPSPQNVNELPYSFTLSPVPTLLHQASDTPISKTYTIPSSQSLPYPTLPINFPNLATYLQASLDESRRYLNDSSSDHRKLARMMDACYKSDIDIERALERQGVGGLLKKVIGRAGKTSKRGANEDTYELVTPFVADEWG